MGKMFETTSSLIQHFKSLGLQPPTDLSFLPINYEQASSPEEFYFSSQTAELERHLELNDISFQKLNEPEDPSFVDNRSDDLILPTLIHFAHSIALPVILPIISRFLYDKLQKIGISRDAKMTIINVEEESVQYLNYHGPVEGLSDIQNWKSNSDK